MRRFLSTFSTRAKVATILATIAVTLVVVVAALNLMTGEKPIRRHLEHLYAIADPQFQRTLGVLLGPVILPDNRFEVLLNGDRIFPAMLAAIRGAQRTITFETYIYWSGRIGDEFANALAERARAGVKVHVLLDWVGSARMEERLLREMEDAGIEVRKFHAPHWYTIDKLNNRTHRKLLVVDGVIGFTGGVGIGDEWSGHAQDPEHWRDTHFRAEVPLSPRCRPSSTTTGRGPPETSCTAKTIFPRSGRRGARPARCSRARRRVAARACSSCTC